MKQHIDTEIQFSGLKSGVYDYEVVLNKEFFESFENELLSDGDVKYAIKLEKRDRLLTFNFTFSGKVKTICDRCLGELEIAVEGEEMLCVKFSDTEVSDEENVVYLPESAYKIDLAQWLYEYVVVAMPMQCVHADDEEGNPTCDPEMLKYLVSDEERGESEETIDPRWAILKELNNN